MSSPSKEMILDALRQVIDPDLHKDIVTLGFVTEVSFSDGVVKAVINLTTPACPVKDQLRDQAKSLIEALPGVTQANVEMTAEVRGNPAPRQIAKNVRHFVAVSSGKGGVGKSTATVNLACALAKTGAKVGVLDCDIYGPDIPMMMGLFGQPDQKERKLIPKQNHGVKTMSIGYLLEEDKPVIWRGPMVHKLIEQFLGDVEWGELDYLLVDMPPGTGDAQLSLAQIVPLSGAVLVTTPQAVSTFDVGKSIGMFKQVNVEVLGIIENMAGYAIEGQVNGAKLGQSVEITKGDRTETVQCDADGKFSTIVNIFGSGGAKRLADKHGLPLLGHIPLNPAVRVGGDGGAPVVITDPDGPLAKAFMQIAGKLAQRLAIREHAELPILQ